MLGGCEVAVGKGTKYVKEVTTDVAGKILVTVQGTGESLIDDKILTLTPYADGTFAAAPGIGNAIGAWRCGSIADGTTVATKFLPGSCK